MSFDPDALIDAMAPMLGLTVEEAYREGVRQNLEVAAKAMDLVASAPLEDEAEPAPVFRPEDRE